MSNHFATVQSYSETALYRAIETLSRNPRRFNEGSWEERRLEALKTEANRRNSKRRGKKVA